MLQNFLLCFLKLHFESVYVLLCYLLCVGQMFLDHDFLSYRHFLRVSLEC